MAIVTSKSNKVTRSVKSGQSNKDTQTTRPNMSKSSDRQTITKMPNGTNRTNRLSKGSNPKLLVNIDTVHFAVKEEQENSFVLQDATKAIVTNADGEVLNILGNWVSLSGKDGIHNLYIRTKNFGKTLLISGSPFAFKYGQNVYTSSNMQAATIGSLKRVCKDFGIKPTPEQRQRWIEGDIHLERVDLAVNIKVGSEEEATDILRQIRLQLGEQQGSMRTSGTTVYWSPKDGKEYSIVFYAKGPQMRRQKRYFGQPFRDKLVSHCECIIRIELKLQARELRKLGLNKVSAWNDNTAEKVFRKYMHKKIKLFSVTSGPVTKEELVELPSQLRAVLALHKSGIELSTIYPKRTFQRHMSNMRELHGIDLKCPNQAEGTVVPLKSVLSPGKVINSAPKWMRDKKLAPISHRSLPKKK